MRSKLRLSRKEYQNLLSKFAKEDCLTVGCNHSNLIIYGEFGHYYSNKKKQVIFCSNCFKSIIDTGLNKEDELDLANEMNKRLIDLITYIRYSEMRLTTIRNKANRGLKC